MKIILLQKGHRPAQAAARRARRQLSGLRAEFGRALCLRAGDKGAEAAGRLLVYGPAGALLPALPVLAGRYEAAAVQLSGRRERRELRHAAV